MIEKRTAILLLLVGLVAFIAFGCLFFLPQQISVQYKHKVQTAADPFEGNFRDLIKTTELPLITNLSASSEIRKENADQVNNLISVTRQNIANLKKVTNSYVLLPYPDVFGRYDSLYVLENHTVSFIGQSEEAINDYEMLVKYLEVYTKATDEVKLELNNFNSVIDVNNYTGQSEQISQVATKIRLISASLSKANCPTDLQQLHTATVAVFDEAANGFDDLSYGIALPADGPIYAAALRIEKAAEELESIIGIEYDKDLQNSRIISNVQDLVDKLELVRSA